MKGKLTLLLVMASVIALLIHGGVDLPDSFQTNNGGDKQNILVDEAGLLASSDLANDIPINHRLLLEDFDIDYRVVLASGIANLNNFAARQFDEIRVGSLSQTARGLLLVIDPDNDVVRMEVGRNLEGIYTDAFVAYIENKQMVPFFQKERIAQGILATTELIVSRAQKANANKEFTLSTLTEPSTGAGAITKANIGKKTATDFSKYPQVASSDSPSETVAVYIEAMRNQNSRPDLDIYSKDSREILKEWVVTAAQMRNTVKEHMQCKNEQTRIKGDLAAVFYDSVPEFCNPYLLRKDKGKWRIDIAFMQQFIRFDSNNHWHMPWGAKAYSFAFPKIKPYSPKKNDCRWCFTFNSDTLVITSIDKGSIGEQMGLREGDKIIAIDEIKTPTMRKIFNYLYDVKKGEVVKITVERGRQPLTFSHPAPP